MYMLAMIVLLVMRQLDWVKCVVMDVQGDSALPPSATKPMSHVT